MPTEAELRAEHQQQEAVNPIYAELLQAHERGYVDYRKHYLAYGNDKARAYAKKQAVWVKLIKLWEKHSVAVLFVAYNALEPGAYGSDKSFGNALRAAGKAAAADELAKFVPHGNHGNKNANDTLPEHEALVRLLVSTGKGFEAPFICEKVNWMCDEMGITKQIKVSWVKKFLARPDVMFATDGYRYGLDKARKELPYLVLESALFANDQWQLDGWHVPFVHSEQVTKEGRTVKKLARLVVFVVRDAHSRKVLGYAFGDTENTALILKALRKAVEYTGKVPAELVVDNHSFNQTTEIAYLKQGLADLGTTWTVTMNPQHKAIVERYFNLFDERFCKPEQGWIGGSPLSRKLNARPKVEVRDELKKPLYTRGKKEVLALVTRLLETANAAPTTTRQPLSPNERYEASQQPNARPVEATDLMQLFWKTTRCTMRRGGITLEKEGQRHYFKPPTGALQERLYKQEVIVRYDDDYERIYLFDTATEALICHIDRSKVAHGAKANQEGEDMSAFAKHGHLLQDIERTRRQSNERVRDELEAYGEVPYQLVSQLSTPKADYQSADTEYRIGQVLKEHDVNEDLLVSVPALDPLKGTVFSQTARRNAANLGEAGRVGKPFTVSANLGLVSHELPDEDD